jgi:hypothetical protein
MKSELAQYPPLVYPDDPATSEYAEVTVPTTAEMMLSLDGLKAHSYEVTMADPAYWYHE